MVNATGNTNGVYNIGIPDLKINFTGSNTISSDDWSCLNFWADTEITGTGNLTALCTGDARGAFVNDVELKITGGCNVNLVGISEGIYGNDEPNSSLVVENSTLKVESGNGSIKGMNSLTLIGCAIIAPEGAAFDESLGAVALDGSIVTEQVVIEPTVGIQNPDNIEAFSIYPNPASDYLSISMNTLNTDKQNIQLYDISGKLVLSRSITDKTIKMNIKHLENGVYIVKIGNNFKRFIKK